VLLFNSLVQGEALNSGPQKTVSIILSCAAQIFRYNELLGTDHKCDRQMDSHTDRI